MKNVFYMPVMQDGYKYPKTSSPINKSWQKKKLLIFFNEKHDKTSQWRESKGFALIMFTVQFCFNFFAAKKLKQIKKAFALILICIVEKMFGIK